MTHGSFAPLGFSCPRASSLLRPDPRVCRALRISRVSLIPQALLRQTVPAFTVVPSARAALLTPVGPSGFPVAARDGARLPPVLRGSPPTMPPLPAILGGVCLRRCKVRFMLRPAHWLRTPGWLLDTLSSALFAPPVAGCRCAPSSMGERAISHHQDFHLAGHDSYLGCTRKSKRLPSGPRIGARGEGK